MGHVWDKPGFGFRLFGRNSYLAGIMQRPWQESNLRHTV